MSELRLWIGLLLVFSSGCREQNTERPNTWSQPQETAKSSDSLSTSFSLYTWNVSLLALGGDAGTYAARVWEEDARIWKPVSLVIRGGSQWMSIPKQTGLWFPVQHFGAIG